MKRKRKKSEWPPSALIPLFGAKEFKQSHDYYVPMDKVWGTTSNLRFLYSSPESANFVYRPENVTIGWKMAEVPRILNDEWLLSFRLLPYEPNPQFITLPKPEQFKMFKSLE